ncbi:putative ubiquitin fusion degradation protein [Neolecta irregularis DAH-3]|uniref:HECT-type E3 ubiquitin transferase n=1 Tax=Neolecta irregularis (strain DAH-3) TaxID=1198029 RepID=A0A1U7LVV1_NEOID|nr:putative ubiquitin fusion degradation protein [Neolecta irregularis DAH-3]|eukprot:OLL26764.1 putative ubiquitin fusion degradation protein [Neolecta irregularis DAH-3]
MDLRSSKRQKLTHPQQPFSSTSPDSTPASSRLTHPISPQAQGQARRSRSFKSDSIDQLQEQGKPVKKRKLETSRDLLSISHQRESRTLGSTELSEESSSKYSLRPRRPKTSSTPLFESKIQHISRTRNTCKMPRSEKPSSSLRSKGSNKRSGQMSIESQETSIEREIFEERATEDRSEHEDETMEELGEDAIPDRGMSLGSFLRRNPSILFGRSAFLGGMTSSVSPSRFKIILANLREKNDQTIRLVALQELAEILAVSTEESLAGYFSAEPYIHELVDIMRGSDNPMFDNPELMVLACRCLANLMEALPATIGQIVYGGAVPVLCQKLLEIQYIDVAEQALTTLEKISVDYPSSIVREGGLAACLSFLDFFATNVQRTAVITAANCCTNIPYNCFSIVRDVIPILQQVVAGSDHKVVEQGCIAIARIVNSFKAHPAKLEELLQPSLLEVIIDMLLPSKNNNLSPSIHTQFLRLLGTISRTSFKLRTQLHKMNVGAKLYQIMSGVAFDLEIVQNEERRMVILQSMIHRNYDQIFETLSTIYELLPVVPNEGEFPSILPSPDTSDKPTSEDIAEKQQKFMEECRGELLSFAIILAPVLVDLYSSTVNIIVRQRVLTSLLRIVSNFHKSMLEETLKDIPFAPFLASILSQKDNNILVMDALHLSHDLLLKLPDIYLDLCEREGVIMELETEPDIQEVEEVAIEISGSLGCDEDHGVNGDDDEDDEDDVDEEESEMDDEVAVRHLTTTTQDGTDDMRQKATQILLTYEKARKEHESSAQASTNLKQLEILRDALEKGVDFDENFANLSTFFDSNPSKVSSYELLNSGILTALYSALTSDHPSRITIREAFCRRFMTPFSGSSQQSALSVLVRKLHELLGRSEKFEVYTAGDDYMDEKRRNSTSALSRQMKLRLIPEGSTDVGNISGMIISIHAIATFKTLDDFLRSRIFSSDISSSTPRRSLSSLLGARSIVPESIQTKSNVRTGKDHNTKETPLQRPRSISKGDDSHSEDGEESINVEETPGGRLVTKRSDGTQLLTPLSTPRQGTPSQIQNIEASRKHNTYAAALQSPPENWHFEFWIGNNVVAKDSTIYGAISKHCEVFALQSLSQTVQTIKFRKVSGPDSHISVPRPSAVDTLAQDINSRLAKYGNIGIIMQLLAALNDINSTWQEFFHGNTHLLSIKSIPSNVFINPKITAKFSRQLDEPLIIASSSLPSWCEDLALYCPFLLPFETRYLFLKSTAFGYSRSLTRWQSQQNRDTSRRGRVDDSKTLISRTPRQKVRMQRDRMLDSALKIFRTYGSPAAILEVEYYDEVGTGLGPTLEFYATVSKEFSQKSLSLWRGSNSSAGGSYVHTSEGLFPNPINVLTAKPETLGSLLAHFKGLGQFIARSMLDSRIIDIHFNPLFLRLAQTPASVIKSVGLIRHVDKDLFRALCLLDTYIAEKKRIKMLNIDAVSKGSLLDQVQIDDISLEDLCLHFTLPGFSDVELMPNGAETAVTIDNVESFVHAVIDFTVGSGIQRQIDAFREGFSSIFSFDSLRTLFVDELIMLFGQADEDWSIETLTTSIKADHGFHSESVTIKRLIEVMSEFDTSQRRQLLQFLTGSPRLPIGGFQSLSPPLTVVCKPNEPPLTSDDYLPSVMTCVNYLKLPDYSSKDVLRKRILSAAVEGRESFHLS